MPLSSKGPYPAWYQRTSVRRFLGVLAGRGTGSVPLRRLGPGADADERLGGAALRHGGVGVVDVVQAGLVVEYQARVDAAGEDVTEQLGNVAAGRGDAAAQADVAEDDRLQRDGEVVRDTDGADDRPDPGDAECGVHGLAGAGAFQGGGADTAGHVHDQLGGVVTALGDDVGGAELAGEGLTDRVAAE